MTHASVAQSLLASFADQRAVDVTAFVGTWPARLPASATAASLSGYADDFGLDALWVSHIASVFGFDTRTGNEALLDEVADDSRLWPFVVIHPGEPGWAEELDLFVVRGARGVRLVPGHHGYDLRAPAVGELVTAVRELGLPLHVCARLDDVRLRHPRFVVDEVPPSGLAEFLRLAEGHPVVLSGLNVVEWTAQVLPLLNAGHDLSRVAVDLWFTNGPLDPIEQLCADGHTDRFVYGSAIPIQTPHATALQLMTPGIDTADRAALCRKNAYRVLGASSAD